LTSSKDEVLEQFLDTLDGALLLENENFLSVLRDLKNLLLLKGVKEIRRVKNSEKLEIS